MPDTHYLQLLAVLVISSFVSYAGVRAFRGWSLGRNILDHPNERSSHVEPTPRGGGVIIVAMSLTAYATICLFDRGGFSWGYFFGAAIVALVSWLDDLYSLPFGWRLAVHVIASLMLIADLGYFNSFAFSPAAGSVHFSAFGLILTFCWLIWMINAYNFMDGTDGIAGLQAVVAGGAWAAVALIFGAHQLTLFSTAVAAASFGFLILNWQPAKIFMGDVGSAFLGFTFAAMPLLAATAVPLAAGIFPTVGLMFVWPFVFDTILTFCRRLAKRHRVWEAHREHLYQRMVSNGTKHWQVALIFAGMSALLAVGAVFAVLTGGIFVLLLIFCILVVSAALVWLAGDKKALT